MVSLLKLEQKILKIRLKNEKAFYLTLVLVMPYNIVSLIHDLARRLGLKSTKIIKFLTPMYVSLKLLTLPKQEKLLYNLSWNLLLVLDACRYDYFVEALRRKNYDKILGYPIPVLTSASYTGDWVETMYRMHKNMTNNNKIVIIAANPFYAFLKKKGLKSSRLRIEHVWDYGFDNKLRTVSPQAVVKAYIKVLTSSYSGNERIKLYIVHFMQPHFPSLNGKVQIAENKLLLKLIREGILSPRDVKISYLNNLFLVLDYAIACLAIAKIAGLKKVVITTDHGDLLEFGGHPCNLNNVYLSLVPWLEVDLRKVDLSRIIEKNDVVKWALTYYKLYRRIHSMKTYFMKGSL